MEVAYQEFRPLLLGALGRLARQGFVVSPPDSMDLIHDFFAEAWNKLVANYNPGRGVFKAYVYGAFVHFVRPRIVRLQRLQNFLVEPAEMEAIADEHIEAERDFAHKHDAIVVQKALAQLPPLERDVLSSYVYAMQPSERMLAQQFDVSRYRLREILVESMGRVMVSLHRPDGMADRDWNVALALWRDERTMDETAAYLRLTKHQVREANSRNSRLLAEALKYYQPAKGQHVRRRTMRTQSQINPPQELLARLLRSQGDEYLLQQARERAGEILAAIEDSESFSLSEDEIREIDPLWLAEVYGVISEAAGQSSIAPEEISQDLFYAQASEEASIGDAFKETLLPGLPDHLREIGRWLSSAPRVSEEEIRELSEEPSVRAGLPDSAQLIPFGCTPLTVFYSTEAVSMLLYRLMRLGILAPDCGVILEMNRVGTEGRQNDVLNLELIVDEIGKVAECNENVSHGLFAWSAQVAQYKPFLFGGFQAEPVSEGVRLWRTGEQVENIFQRWGLTSISTAAVT